MKQINFRAKVHGRISFAFSKCQTRPKIRACGKSFSPLTEIRQKASPAFQPTRLYVCPALSKRWHIMLPNICHGLPDPGSFLRGRSQLCPSCTSHQALHPSLSCTRQWTMADGSEELNSRLRIHSSPTGLSGFSHHRSFVFSQDLSTWKREQLRVLALVFFKVIRVNVTHILWVCDSRFLFLLLRIFMFLSWRS